MLAIRKYYQISIVLLILFCGCSLVTDRFPQVSQESAAQCGPACLQMICKYYGANIDMHRMEYLTEMTEDGTSLLGLCNAADSLGLKSLGVKITYEQLFEEQVCPAIIHWDNKHFVVAYRITENKVWVADPALGKKEYTKEEFCKYWIKQEEPYKNKGIALLLEPTAAFYDNNTK